MEAPEKIYLVNDDLNIKREWYKTKQVDFDTTEYIRKDLVDSMLQMSLYPSKRDIQKEILIEKAVEYITNNMRCDGYTLQTKARFIKDFKNYMKGE